jgi:hypothetical protein
VAAREQVQQRVWLQQLQVVVVVVVVMEMCRWQRQGLMEQPDPELWCTAIWWVVL